jgi:hypothetical protein
MGRASSSKKVNKAAKTAGKPGDSSNALWFGALAVVVLLGVGLIGFTIVQRPDEPDSDVAPQVGEHWHAAYGINVCGEWQQPLQDVRQDVSGIHTHADGLVHIHPFSSRYAGEGANLGVFGEMVGLELAEDSITLPDGETYSTGDDCNGEEGEVRVVVWDDPTAEEPREVDGDPASYAPQDTEVVTIAFLPVGAEVEMPPTVPRLQDPLAAEEGRQPVPIQDEAVPDVPDDAIVDEVAPESDASPDDGAEGDDAATTTTAAP